MLAEGGCYTKGEGHQSPRQEEQKGRMMYAQVSQRKADPGSDQRSEQATRLILVAQSDKELGVLASGLANFGVEVKATTFTRFTWRANEAFDVALVSATDPGTAAEQAVQLLKSRLGVPVLALVSMTALVSAVAGLRADDVAFLPVRVEELKARIDLLLGKARQNALGHPFVERRRSPGTSATTGAPAVSSQSEREQLMVIDREKKVIVRGTPVRLSPNLYKLLMLLASDPGRVFSIREISGHLWPKKAPQCADVQQSVHLLRKKIEEDPRNPSWVESIPGFGYKLNRPVQR